MTFNQKLINFLAITVFAGCLYLLNEQVHSIYHQQHGLVSLLQTIGRGEAVDATQLKSIVEIASQEITGLNENSPVCFLKAFHAIVVSKSLNPYDLFTLFVDDHTEYENIRNCSHYLSLLLYRAERLTSNDSQTEIIQELLTLEQTIVNQQYPSPAKHQKICLYFHVHNGETIIQQQFTALASQQYNNSLIVMEDDGSIDNTPIFIKYMMQQNPDKIVFTENREARGMLKGVGEFMNRCEDGSVVVLMQGNQYLLGSSALAIIDRVFSDDVTELAFLGTLTLPHMNIHNIKSSSQLNTQINPFIAFRKSLATSLNLQATDFQGFERNLIASQLVKIASKTAGSIKIVNEALLYRGDRHNQALSIKLQQLLGAASN